MEDEGLTVESSDTELKEGTVVNGLLECAEDSFRCLDRLKS
jgi:hypothetical protein